MRNCGDIMLVCLSQNSKIVFDKISWTYFRLKSSCGRCIKSLLFCHWDDHTGPLPLHLSIHALLKIFNKVSHMFVITLLETCQLWNTWRRVAKILFILNIFNLIRLSRDGCLFPEMNLVIAYSGMCLMPKSGEFYWPKTVS